jgi:hypothetical protein
VPNAVQLFTALTSAFGALVLLALVAAGVVMMFSPSDGRLLLKNTLIALALFVAGSVLAQAACEALRMKP